MKANFVLNLIGAVGVVFASVIPQTVRAAHPKDISAGGQHTCVVTSEGRVKCIGANVHGELGDGSTESSTDYVRVVDPDNPSGFLSGAVAVSVGGDVITVGRHTCALIEGGGVKCWGSNYGGQLGNGSTARSSVPVNVESSLPMTSVALGNDFTCALTDPAGVQCWGDNSSGNLGDGTTAGYSPYPIEVNVFPNVAAVTAGRGWACALSTSGHVKCWGNNFFGQLGRGTVGGSFNPTPDFVRDPDAPDDPLSGVVAISTKSLSLAQTVCAAIEDGSVKCWGALWDPVLREWNDNGLPVDVSDGSLNGAVEAVSTDNYFTCAVAGGGVKCWGSGSSGQLGDGTWDDYSLVPRNVQLLTNTVTLSTGSSVGGFACAIGDPYGASCWGKNNFTPYSPISATDEEIEYIYWGDNVPFPVDVIFDEEPPTIVSDVVGRRGNNYWYISDVTVAWSVTDLDSEITSTSGCEETVLSTDTSETTLTCTAEDSEGNEDTESVTIKRDATAPNLEATALPEPNANGWNNTDVTVEFSCTDATSGIDFGDSKTTVLSIEGTGVWAHHSCTDFAGNESGTQYFVNIDKTAPTVSATVSPAPNGNGWNNTDVTVEFSGTDNLSGIASCSPPRVLSQEGTNISAAGYCTDRAGNEGPTEYTGINIDKTAPTVTVTGVADDATYILGNVPAAGCGTTDTLSGVETEASLIVIGGTDDGTGNFIATCRGARDAAGNTGSASVNYLVVTPQAATLSVIDEIEELSNLGVLNDGQATSLTAQLEVVIARLNNGQPRVVVRVLTAFAQHVYSLMSEGVLSDKQGATLINEANEIITAISP